MQQLNVVQFHYTPEFACHFGLASSGDTGIIAQEVQRILPEAVSSAGNVQLPDGTRYDNFLLVNKVRLSSCRLSLVLTRWRIYKNKR